MVNIISLATGSGLIEPPEDEMAAFTELITNPYRIYSTWPQFSGHSLAGTPVATPDGTQLGSWRFWINEQGTGANTWHAEAPYLLIDTGIGFNKGKMFAEGRDMLKRPGLVDVSPGMDFSENHTWRYRKIFGGWLSGTNFGFSTSDVSPTCIVGFGQGWHDSSFLTTTPYVDPPNDDFVHMRIRGDILKWELVVGVRDVGTTVIELTNIEDPVPPLAQAAWFEWMPPDPMGTGGPFVKAYVNGVLGAEITDPDLLPGNGVDQWGGGTIYNCIFAMTGDGSGGAASGVGYSTARFGPFFAQEFGVMAAGA